MSDLREALDYLTVGQGSANLAMAGIKKPDWDALDVAVAAARRWLALTETGRRRDWCETHEQSAPPCGARMNCNTLPVLVIPADYLTEEETE